MPWAAVAGAVIGAAGSAYASRQQSNATQQASADAARQFDLTRQDYAPWRAAGQGSLSALMHGMGISPLGQSAQNAYYGGPQLSQTQLPQGYSGQNIGIPTYDGADGGYGGGSAGNAGSAGNGGYGGNDGDGVGDADGFGGIGGNDGDGVGDGTWKTAPREAFLDEQTGQTIDPRIIGRYADQNALGAIGRSGGHVRIAAEGMGGTGPNDAPLGYTGPGFADRVSPNIRPQIQQQGGMGFGDLNRNFSLADFNQDPGYDFRMREGMRAREMSAAARGGLLGGGAGRALERYGQEYASGEYQNSFNRYNSNRDGQFNRLATIAGIGQTATRDVAQFGANNSANQTSLALQGANARAAGTMGVVNAGTNALGSIYQNNQYNQMLNQLGQRQGYGSNLNIGSDGFAYD